MFFLKIESLLKGLFSKNKVGNFVAKVISDNPCEENSKWDVRNFRGKSYAWQPM
jgi:hypothetical protein